MFLKTKLAESKKCPKDLAETIAGQFPTLNSTLDALEAKLNKFRKDTVERKTTARLADLVEPVTEAETKMSVLKDAAKPLSAYLEEASIEGIKVAIEKCVAPEKEAAAAIHEAKKNASSKLNSFKSSDGAAGVAKINLRLGALQNYLVKHRKVVEKRAASHHGEANR
jgi:uncharacterized protein YgbK (DUF1537 family)